MPVSGAGRETTQVAAASATTRMGETQSQACASWLRRGAGGARGMKACCFSASCGDTGWDEEEVVGPKGIAAYGD